ncbi:MAG: isoprenylcysteine carboxylmethyltransferase family protein [Dehalococcoidia bacterium]|jgi:protein-S-isoprenylcysteine O-methyltransferase Ste14
MSLVPAFEIGLWNAWLFMCVFILQMLAVMLLGDKQTWERSGHPADMPKSKLEKQAGLIGNIVWGLATIYSVFLPLKLGTPWFYIGLPVFLVGLLLLAVATVNFTNTPLEKPATGGVYRFSRHPIYLAMTIIYIGVIVATASWVFLLLSIANVYWVAVETRVEERYCLQLYGEAYRKYLKQTPKWLGLPKPV